MFGRVSIFGDERVVQLVKSKFIPVAVAIGTHGRAEDREGELYRKLVAQRSTESFQGFYVFDTQCHVLAHEGGSRHDAEAVHAILEKTSREFRSVELPADDQPAAQQDLGVFHQPPAGGSIVEVNSKLLDGLPGAVELTAETNVSGLDKSEFKLAVFNQSFGRDRLWIRPDETKALAAGRFPHSLTVRIARFHLVDNTRCFPLFWEAGHVRKASMTFKDGLLQGQVHLETDSGDRGYIAEIYGRIDAAENGLFRFDIVAKGRYWGGKDKAGHRPPDGKFPFAVAFKLSDGQDRFDIVPPAGIKHDDYFK